ncbi:ABC transporter permease [Streptantibioticus cattleyicolor]|uniref:Putative ABC transporter permease protein n=1 Tax=Streptantibioticus cattleyicolor (strain ATCC 35852 / DSM 46488 / JCM 4925 / NBRC 14057 / NRRL 8057) TaxID=1003195 RepID=F8JM85_STREN|nr:ABC transporter permease [Streptantibioticus cattleyicolor]AEW99589.1 putative ABC transporter permease protein [Streptantibioticus cattleyicolor NRRL 8057 = DSM 46488]CCB71373.1 Sio5 [Streptantibioticus cattleyicolor NRRL 8057 = DSM 46488]
MLTTALRNLLADKARLVMTALAICLGVAFVSGTLVFADSAAQAQRAAASRSFADIAVTVTPKDPPPGTAATPRTAVLDDALAGKLARVPGVTAVRPSVDGTATLDAADGSPLRAGSAWANPAAAYLPGPDGTDSRYPLAEGRAPGNGGELAVDSGTAAAGHLRLGDPVTLATDGPVMTKRLVGIVTTKDPRVTAGGTLTLFDKATAQRLFASPGRYTAIDLSATPGTDPYQLQRRVTAVLPAAGAEAVTGAAQAAQQAAYVDTLTRGYVKLPLVLAGVSLFIGSFLIVNTFSTLVTRRARQIALLRAIGASRRQVVRSVLAEAAALGLAASGAGFLLGLGVAAVLPGVLGDARHALPSGPLVIAPRSVVAALGAGVGVTVLAAWLPSRRAAKVAPVEAMRSAEQPPSAVRSRIRGVAGVAGLVLGVGLLASLTGAKDASVANLRAAMLGCALLVVGLTGSAPLLAGPVIGVAGRLTGRFGVAGRLAVRNALRDPRRTAATASALMVSTALVAGLAVIGDSTGRALDRQAAAGLTADYVIGARTPTVGITPSTVRRVAKTPGVRTAVPVADSTLLTGGRLRQISGIDPGAVGTVLALDFVSGSPDRLGPGRIAVSATMARESGLRTGSGLVAGLGRDHAPGRYTVVGVYQDNPVAHDALATRDEVWRHGFTPGSAQRVLVRTTDGATPATQRRLRTALGHNPLLTVEDRRQLVDEAAGVMGDLLTLMYGLLAVGTVIAALGVVNPLALSVSERTREIGVLRALGMDRAAIRRMIRLESVTVAAFGTLLGLAGGLFAAWAVGALANGAMAHYTLVLPWGTLLAVCLLSLAVGVLAAAVPARRAAALSPLEAVAKA